MSSTEQILFDVRSTTCYSRGNLSPVSVGPPDLSSQGPSPRSAGPVVETCARRAGCARAPLSPEGRGMHPLTSLNASRPTSLQDVPQDRSAPTHGARVPQTSPPSPTILIVEDEPSIASALTEAMTQEILEPTDSGARGYYAVLRRVHEPL